MSASKTVVIFGAGVTGLTAAHELIERGWKVFVVEKEIDPLDIDQCAVGGIAKTQWAAYKPPQQRNDSATTEVLPLVPTARLRLRSGVELSHTPPSEVESLLDVGSAISWERLLRRIADIRPHVPALLVSYSRQNDATFAQAIVAQLNAAASISQAPANVAMASQDASLPAACWQVETNLKDRGDGTEPGDFSAVLPGEHGFRFFPGFYRHIFDTLRRIPVRPAGGNYDDAFRAVFDNLLPTEANWLAISDKERPDSPVAHATDGNNVVKFPRRLRRSLREVFDATQALQTQLGYAARDVELLKLRLFKYMTSCRQRRKAEYEQMSWADFMGLQDLSPLCKKDMERAPQLLAAMTASESDARTQGNIATQLLLDPINDDERVDATLNAPTSVAWFSPWKEYLASQGVQFVPGELIGFKNASTGDGCEVRPVLAESETKRPKELDTSEYYILALPIQAWRPIAYPDGRADLTTSWCNATNNAGKDQVHVLAEWFKDYVAPGASSTPWNGHAKLLKGLSGIQFYFDHDQMRRSGHTLFMDSQWRLSAISQASFWHRRRESFDGYRGLLSVDIGALEKPSTAEAGDTRPWFWDLKRAEVHGHVWDQIQTSYGAFLPPSRGVATYRLYHLDELIEYDAYSKPKLNRAPFLINGVGEWDHRPGWCAEPESGPVESPSKARYELMPKGARRGQPQWVLAGTFMKTWTRATTMESANESARHAVNSLLDHAQSPAEACPIWNPEEYEHPDLLGWQELDARLFNWEDGQPLPHMLDILELDALSAEILDSGGLEKIVDPLTRAVKGGAL